MKKLRTLLFLLLSLALTGCFDITEELTLNKDGSGIYSLSFDLSKLMQNPMFNEVLQENQNAELPNLSEKVDTIIKFTDLPAEKKQQLDRPAFWDKVSLQIVSDEQAGEMKSTLLLNFDDLSDIEYFYKNLDKFNDSGNIASTESLGGAGNFLGGGAMFVLKGKKLTRLEVSSEPAFADAEELEFAKMFFASGTYTTIYNLPGRVKKVSRSNARISGNQVTFKYALMDIINAETSMGCDIRFK